MPLSIKMNAYYRERGQRSRRLNLLQPPRSLPRSVLYGSKRLIDPESGQVSEETLSREFQVSEIHWAFQYEDLLEQVWGKSIDHSSTTAKEAAIAYSKRRSRRVPRLNEIALDKIIQNVANLTLESIQYMPPVYVEFLWRELSKRCVNSFNTWKIFSKTLERKEDAILSQFRYSKAIAQPVPFLSIYTKPLASTTFDFLVHLSITTAFNTSDLVELYTLTNLVALEIIKSKHFEDAGKVFGDRVIKSWSEQAIKGKGFKVLRILKLRNFQEVTNNCFQYLNAFPALAVFDVLDCGFKGLAQLAAERLGWEVHPHGVLHEILQSDCVKHVRALRTTLGLPNRPIRRSAAIPSWDRAKVTMVPRADIPAFLTRDPASAAKPLRDKANVKANVKTVPQTNVPALITRDTASSAPASNLNITDTWAKKQSKLLERTLESRSKPARMDSSHFEAIDLYKRYREPETWDFCTITSLDRISELRNDEDLLAAGLDIGDSVPTISGELISAIPIASLRLGPERSIPRSREGSHQGYESGMANRSLNSSRDKGVRAKGWVYTRIKVPVTEMGVGEHAKGEAEDEAEDEAEGEADGSGSRRVTRRKFRGEKRRQIGDLLAGVMGGCEWVVGVGVGG